LPRVPLTLPPVIEPLARSHNRENFDCGETALNDYLHHQAMQDMRRGVSRVYVARERGSSKVFGYYTLSATSFSKKSLPESEAKRLPHYPVPAALLGRLAVDRSCQGQRLGKYLLFDAFHRVLQVAETLAVYALIVDAKNDEARAFYEHYGFLRFPETLSRLFIPIETLRRAAE
jgi:ribosomal protein S18 acetylase RimI-like enzyme